MEDIGVYIDNIGFFSMTWEHNMLHLDRILPCLEANEVTFNPFKYEKVIQETY